MRHLTKESTSTFFFSDVMKRSVSGRIEREIRLSQAARDRVPAGRIKEIVEDSGCTSSGL